jgi:hypothetical protein
MKTMIDILLQHGIICPRLSPIDKKELGIKKKLELYHGVDKNSHYTAIIHLQTKSRFIQKNVLDIEALFQLIKEKIGHNCKHKIVVLQSPLCSKAEARLKTNGWRVIIDTV